MAADGKPPTLRQTSSQPGTTFIFQPLGDVLLIGRWNTDCEVHLNNVFEAVVVNMYTGEMQSDISELRCSHDMERRSSRYQNNWDMQL